MKLLLDTHIFIGGQINQKNFQPLRSPRSKTMTSR